MPDEPLATSPEANRAFQVKIHMDVPLTVVEVGPVTVAFTGSHAPTPTQEFVCRAASRLMPPATGSPVAEIYFGDLDHARRAIAGPDTPWAAPAPLIEPRSCRFQLVRKHTTLPVPPGAPVHLFNLDHAIHLAVRWYELQRGARR